TTIRVEAGEPVQIVGAPFAVDLPVDDVPDEDAARASIARESLSPFDLGQGPLFRLHLLRLSAEECLLLMVMHHIVTDGWSMGVMVKDFVSIYEAAARGEKARLAPLPIQYADFAVWQRARMTGQVLDEHLRYWTRQLEGAPPTLDLPIAGRNRPEIEHVLGFFINTLPMRVRWSGDPTVGELLEAVREVALGAYAHQDLPFERLLEDILVERDQSRAPVFQAIFVVQNAPMPALALPGL